MIDLYTAATSNGLRAAVILEECGLPYKATLLDIFKGETRTAKFLAINPLGTIPVIVDSDGPGGKPFTLSQSWAIILYCAEKAGKFIPKSPQARALAYQWLIHSAVDITGTSTALFHTTMRAPEKSAKNQEYFEGVLGSFFKTVDQRLGEAEFLAGEFSVADFGLYPTYNARKAVADKAGDLKNLKRWAGVVGARPALQKGMKVAG